VVKDVKDVALLLQQWLCWCCCCAAAVLLYRTLLIAGCLHAADHSLKDEPVFETTKLQIITKNKQQVTH